MTFLDTIENEWRDAVARWESVVSQFQAMIERHYANRQKALDLGPEEFDRWQAQLDRALELKTAIEMLQESLASTSSWAKQTFGLNGMKRAMTAMNGMGLGPIPLIPVAVIVGSISAVTAVIYSLNTYNNELDSKWGYINSHPDLTPAQITDILDAAPPGQFQAAAMWIVIGGALLFFAPQLLKRLGK